MIPIDEQLMEEVKRLARWMANKSSLMEMVDDLWLAGMENVVRWPQSTMQRTLSCARNGMKDEMRRYIGRYHHPILIPYDDMHSIAYQESTEDMAVYALDVREWLNSLTPAQRSRAMRRAEGMTAREIARQDGVDESRISQVIGDLRKSWQRYQEAV